MKAQPNRPQKKRVEDPKGQSRTSRLLLWRTECRPCELYYKILHSGERNHIRGSKSFAAFMPFFGSIKSSILLLHAVCEYTLLLKSIFRTVLQHLALTSTFHLPMKFFLLLQISKRDKYWVKLYRISPRRYYKTRCFITSNTRNVGAREMYWWGFMNGSASETGIHLDKSLSQSNHVDKRDLEAIRPLRNFLWLLPSTCCRPDK